MYFTTGTFLLNHVIQKPPGAIVGPITAFLGYIIDFIFNIVYFFTVNHSLGISIIFLTIIARMLMIPLAFNQQKSMVSMQRVQPEIEKIKKKYGDSKDPEIQKKIQTETQMLYSKHKINPFGGCLPLFIQLPIFFALSYLMNTSYRFITQLGSVYNDLASRVMEIPNYIALIRPLAVPIVPRNMDIDLRLVADLEKVLNKFNRADWTAFFNSISNIEPGLRSTIETLFNQKQSIEFFAGIPLTYESGLAFPGILIPILSAVTTFLSSWILSKQQKASDQNAAMTQKVMLIVMPIMMGWMTISMPAGVGLYWITSNLFHLIQQIVLNKFIPFHVAESKVIVEPAKPDKSPKPGKV